MHIKVLHQDFDKTMWELKKKFLIMTISYHANNHIKKEFVELIKYFSLSTLQKGINTEKNKKRHVKFCKMSRVSWTSIMAVKNYLLL